MPVNTKEIKRLLVSVITLSALVFIGGGCSKFNHDVPNTKITKTTPEFDLAKKGTSTFDITNKKEIILSEDEKFQQIFTIIENDLNYEDYHRKAGGGMELFLKFSCSQFHFVLIDKNEALSNSGYSDWIKLHPPLFEKNGNLFNWGDEPYQLKDRDCTGYPTTQQIVDEIYRHYQGNSYVSTASNTTTVYRTSSPVIKLLKTVDEFELPTSSIKNVSNLNELEKLISNGANYSYFGQYKPCTVDYEDYDDRQRGTSRGAYYNSNLKNEGYYYMYDVCNSNQLKILIVKYKGETLTFYSTPNLKKLSQDTFLNRPQEMDLYFPSPFLANKDLVVWWDGHSCFPEMGGGFESQAEFDKVMTAGKKCINIMNEITLKFQGKKRWSDEKIKEIYARKYQSN